MSILFRRAIQFHPIRQIHLTRCLYQERYFTKKHEWIQLLNSNEVRIGISDYAQRALGDVVYCELPSIGTKFKRDDTFATLESVKAVSDCYMPIDGEISGVNEKLTNESDLINKSPYENGWLIQAIVDEKIKKEISSLLFNEKHYKEFLETDKEADGH
jgi:glycine cleavage system H protein